MKIMKNGRVVLSRKETKIGEFVICVGRSHLTIRTTSGNWKMSFRTNMLFAQLIRLMLKEDKLENIKAMIVVLYNATCVLPDVEYLDELNNAVTDCMNRHKDIYGEDVSEEEDQKIIEELKKDQQAQAL